MTSTHRGFPIATRLTPFTLCVFHFLKIFFEKLAIGPLGTNDPRRIAESARDVPGPLDSVLPRRYVCLNVVHGLCKEDS